MPDTKITALTAIGVVDASLDPLPIVDTSDTSMAGTGTTKKISINQILGAGGAGSFSTLAASGAATLSSTLGVTGATTLTGALTANGNVTLGDALADVVTVNGSLTARNGELASSIRAAASNYAGVAFDGATSGTRISSTITTNPITTGDYTVWTRFRVPTTSIAGQDPLWTLGSAADGSGAYGITARYFTASSLFNIAIRSSAGGSSGGDSAAADVTIPFATYAGQVVDLVVVRVGSVLTVYLNGTSFAVTYTGTQASFALAPGNFPTNTAQFFGVGASTTTPFRGPIYRSVLFNRALSAADVVDLIELGVDPADQWGTQTQLVNASTLNGGFETAGAGGADVFADWLETTNGTSTINRDTSVFYAGAASCRFDIDASGSSVALSSAASVFTRGKRYRASCYARGTATTARVGIFVGEALNQPLGAVVDNSSWQYRSLEFVFGSAGTTGASVARYAGTINGSLWIDNFTIERIGAIVDLDFTAGIGYQALDRSTNKLDGTLFGGVSWAGAGFSGTVRGTLTTNAGQQLNGTLAIPTDAHIDYVVVENVSAGSGRTFSLGTASGTLTNIINAQPLGGNGTRTTFDPADGFSSTGNLWAAWSAAGTVKVTVAYRQVL